jgi:hypothetical protein
MKKGARSKTVAEFFAEKQKDPEYAARKAKENRAWAEKDWRLGLAEKPLLSDIKAAGFNVTSVYDLVNTTEPYDAIIPVLLRHIRLPYPSVILEGIARALGVKAVRPHWNELVELYRQADGRSNQLDEDLPRGNLKDGLATALSVIADRTVFDEVVSLLNDRSLGITRSAFVSYLAQSRDPRRWQILEELKNEPELKEEVTRRLQARDKRNKAK